MNELTSGNESHKRIFPELLAQSRSQNKNTDFFQKKNICFGLNFALHQFWKPTNLYVKVN